jgi:hypothetical protein
MQPTFFIFEVEQSTLSYIVVSFAIHFVYTIYGTQQLFANWFEKGKIVASSTESRDFSFDVRVTDIYKGLFYKPIDVEKRTLCLNSKRDITKGSQGILLSRIG